MNFDSCASCDGLKVINCDCKTVIGGGSRSAKCPNLCNFTLDFIVSERTSDAWNGLAGELVICGIGFHVDIKALISLEFKNQVAFITQIVSIHVGVAGRDIERRDKW